MDVLSDVLRAVRLTGAVFFDVEARSPWVATTPAAAKIAPSVMPEAEHVIQFHAVTSGDCWAELLDGSIPPLHLSEGDIVILPMGDQHVFCSEPGLRAEVNLKIYYRPTDRQLPFQVTPPGGDGESTRFTCGYLGCDARPFNPVLQSLPRLLHSRATEGAGCMAQLIQMAINETATRRAGGETVLSRLAELMFVDVLRRYIDTLPKEAGGWLSGLRDQHVGAALALMHGQPAAAWTLERLAHEVGLSRSVFANRFAHFVQDTPMQYLTRWRMQLATHLLERQGVGLAQVAAEVGYESEAAFNRAFKKCVGVPPGAWRRERQTSLRSAAPQ
jgi:AraC-like DNA-binding protein